MKGYFFKGDFTSGQNVYFSMFCISIHDKDFDKGKLEFLGWSGRGDFLT